MKRFLIAALCFVLNPVVFATTTPPPASIAWADYYAGGHATSAITYAGGCYSLVDKAGTNAWGVLSLTTSRQELDAIGTTNWLSALGIYDPNQGLFAVWTGPQDSANNDWGVYTYTNNTLFKETPTYGNAQPLAAQFVASTTSGSPGKRLVAVQYPLQGGGYGLRLFDDVSFAHKDDNSISPQQAAITPNGYIIVSGKDNAGLFPSGGIRLHIYDQNLNLLYWEVNPNPSQSSDPLYSYVISASQNDFVYFARNVNTNGVESYSLHIFDGITNTASSSASRPGNAHRVAGFGQLHFIHYDPKPIYVLSDNAATLEEAFDSQGNSLWTKSIACSEIAADQTGFYQADNPTGTLNTIDLRVRKFDFTGASVWTQTFTPLPHHSMSVVALSAHYPYVLALNDDLNGPSAVAIEFVEGPAVTSFSLTPTTLSGGKPVSGTATMDAPAEADHPQTFSTNYASGAPVVFPANVRIPSGGQSVNFTVGTKGVDRETPVTVNDIDSSGAVRSVILTLEPATVSKLTATTTTPIAGTTTQATLTFNGQTGPSGTKVTFTATAPVIAPAPFTTGPYLSSAKFGFACAPTNTATSATLTATANGTSAQLAVRVEPPTLISITLPPGSIVAGAPFTGKLNLNGKSSTATAVKLVSNSPAFSVFPATVSIPAGQNQLSFQMHTGGVDAATSGTVSASAGKATVVGTVSLTPADVLSASLSASSVVGGSSRSLTITLNGLAGPSGVAFTLAANNPPIILPATGTVATQQPSFTLAVHTLPVDLSTNQQIQVTGTHTQASTTLTVLPASLASLTFSPNPVAGGSAVTATLRLNDPAGPSGLTVSLSSDNGAAHVPSSVHLNGGQLTVSFTVATDAVASTTTANITATLQRDNTTLKSGLTIQ